MCGSSRRSEKARERAWVIGAGTSPPGVNAGAKIASRRRVVNDPRIQ